MKQAGRTLGSRVGVIALAGALAFGVGGRREAEAFPYTAQRGDTLADIAERFYGRVEMERVLVAANGFEDDVPLIAGMRVEVPAVSHYRIVKGDSWSGLAERLLGDDKRAEALALSNDTMPWVPPTPGRELVVPYPLRYVVRRGDSTLSIAYRFLGKRDLAYVVDRYNHLKGEPVEPGDVVLIPVTDLVLTDEGREAARRSQAVVLGEAGGDDADAQDRAARELPALTAEVARGDYVEAIARGNQLLGAGSLTDEQMATLSMALVESYVALDRVDLARQACAEWRRYDPDTPLDPIDRSPKIIRACTTAPIDPQMGAFGKDPPPDAGAPKKEEPQEKPTRRGPRRGAPRRTPPHDDGPTP